MLRYTTCTQLQGLEMKEQEEGEEESTEGKEEEGGKEASSRVVRNLPAPT